MFELSQLFKSNFGGFEDVDARECVLFNFSNCYN